MNGRRVPMAMVAGAVVLSLGAAAAPAPDRDEPRAVYGGTEVLSSAELGAEDHLSLDLGGHASLSWHSNPYYRPRRDSIRSAFILDLDPRAELDMPLHENLYVGLFGKLNLKYFFFADRGRSGDSNRTLEYRSFTDSKDEDKLIVHPYLRGKIRLNLGERTSLALYDDFQQANVDNVGDEREFYLNNAWVEAAHDFTERLLGSVWYRNTFHYQTESSPLFDFDENAAGAQVELLVGEPTEGRTMSVVPALVWGRREYEEDVRFLSPTEEEEISGDPKDHQYLSIGATVRVPLATLLTLYASGGWQSREYETAARGRDRRTGSPWGGVTLSRTPSLGARWSWDLAGSYAVNDTVVYNTPSYNRPVFENEDAVLNELDITYRELTVWRVGAVGRYDFTTRLRGNVTATFQRSEADVEEDLAPQYGYSQATEGGQPGPTQQDELTLGIGATFRVREWLRVGAGYRYGQARDNEAESSHLYDYNELSVHADAQF